MKEKLLKIINNYGPEPQCKKFTEEYFELIESILDFENAKFYSEAFDSDLNFNPLKDHIAEEISDCYVLLEQFRLYFEIPIEQIKAVMEFKINRQDERIANEKRSGIFKRRNKKN